MRQGCLPAFLPSLFFYLTIKSRDRKFMLQASCPLSSAQLLAEAAASGHPPADHPSALCCLWWDSGIQLWQQLEGGQERYKGWLWQNFGAKKANLPGYHCSDNLCSYSGSPRCPSTTQKSRSQLQHSLLFLHTLLLSQTHQVQTTPHAHLSYHALAPAALGTASDVLRTGKVCAYLCLSLTLFVEGQINHKLKLIGM